MSVESKISFYNSAKDLAPSKEITIREFVRAIREGDHAALVERVRSTGTDDEKRDAKMKLPAVQLSGRVTTGNRAQAMTEGRFAHSGWLQLDVDGDGLDGKTPEEARALLGSDKHVLTAFVSPSGKGAKALFRIPACSTDEEHKSAFKTAEKYILEKYHLTIDPAPKSPGSLCYLSADTDSTWQPMAEEFIPSDKKPEPQKPADNKSTGFPEPPKGQGVNDWVIRAARYGEQRGWSEAETCAKIESYNGTLRRSFIDGEVQRAIRKVYDTPSPKPVPFNITRAGLTAGMQAAEDFVEGLLISGGASVIYGPSNCGKSFWILDLASCVATGSDFRDEMQVDQGAVVYVALEGSFGVRNRIEALKRNGRITESTPLFLCFESVSLLEKGHAERLAESVKLAATQSELPCRLVIIDTMARAMAGGDENSGSDMTAAVSAIDAIRAATGAHVAVIHHCGKDEARGARGHSSLRAAVDTEIEVSRPDGESVSTVRITKQRDLPMGEPMPFSLKIIELGTDRRGKPITSCTVHHEDVMMAARPAKGGRKPTCTAEDMLRFLPAASVKEWQERVREETGLGQSQFYSHKSTLEAKGKYRREAATNRILPS